MHRFKVLFAIGALGVLFVATSASAGSHPHDRNGFMIGFGVGGGNAGIEDGDDREWSAVGNFRIGYALRSDLVLHYEGSAWARQFDTVFGDVTWTFSTHTAALTYFPGNTGLLLRGGVGLGAVNVELDSGNTNTESSETGFGFLLAAGYEWRLSRKFALGPHVEFDYQSYGEDVGWSDQISGVLDFNWYW